MEAKSKPDSLALRAPPRPITRLNRRVIAIGMGVVAAGVAGATFWSLQPHQKGGNVGVELHNVDRVAHAEGLEQLPPDYSKLPSKSVEAPPVLGPPLPGDLGAPILRSQTISPQPAPVPPMARPDPAADAARIERANRERQATEAARAPLFFQSSTRKGAEVRSAAAPNDDTKTDTQQRTGKSSSRGAGQEEKNDFLMPGDDVATMSTHPLQLPRSPYTVMAGTIIPAALITGIDSDLPGKVLASVTEPVYDSATGRFLLIPQGSRLVGEYDSQIAAGQRRVLLVWTRLILPDTSSISLDRLPGVDAAGNAGLQDSVDRHWGQILAGAALSTLIGVGAELAAPDRGSGQGQVVVSTRQSVEDSVNQVGQELTRRNLAVQATLTIRAGFPVRVIVARDLILKPYEPLTFGRSP